MIKGINKQIVEIKCTNNEYFDRALLFVSAEKADSGLSGKRLTEEAEKFCGRYTVRSKKHRRKVIVLGVSGAAVLAIVLLLVL